MPYHLLTFQFLTFIYLSYFRDPTHLEGVGPIPLQGIPQYYGEETLAREVQRVDIPPTGGRDGVGGDLRILSPEQSLTVYCNQAYYGTVSGSRAKTGATGLQAVVGEGQGGCGGYVDIGLGGRTYVGGGGDGQDGNEDGRLIMWV